MAKKVVPGRFTPNCGEGTISVGRSLGSAHEFRGWRVQCGLASDPVRPGPGRTRPQRSVGGLGCSLMLAAFPCSMMRFFCFVVVF